MSEVSSSATGDATAGGTQDGTTGAPGDPTLEPAGLEVDPDGNAVVEPDEIAAIRPSWMATGSQGGTVSGALTMLSGPPRAAYMITDEAGQYTFAGGETASCADCYAIEVSGTTRPQVHWDAEAVETLDTGDEHAWTVHIGESFTDVPSTSRYYRAIETLLHHGISGGCMDDEFCPDATMTRAMAATFVANAMVGPDESVPTSGTVPGLGSYDCSRGGTSLYDDVSETGLFCRHIHYLAANGVTEGCTADPPAFCPSADVARWQLAIFAANAIARGASVPSDYTDPDTGLDYDCSAVNPDLQFEDVPSEHLACAHIHYLWARGAEIECTSPTSFCPGGLATRAHGAQFVADAFALSLHAP
jgi:hypothetical protein